MPNISSYATSNEMAHAVDDGVRRITLGKKAPSTRPDQADPSPTEEIEVRKSIEVQPERLPASKNTAVTSLLLPPVEYFKPIKNWEGVVDTVCEDRFFATMREAGFNPGNADQQFEIAIEDVDIGDRPLIVPGAIFYFTVGYSIRRGGTRVKGVQIVFRRMPLWSKRDLQRAKERADGWAKLLDEEEGIEQFG